jgi:hypothetical protein
MKTMVKTGLLKGSINFMSTVYIILGGVAYETDDILCVYSNKQDANKQLEKIQKNGNKFTLVDGEHKYDNTYHYTFIEEHQVL